MSAQDFPLQESLFPLVELPNFLKGADGRLATFMPQFDLSDGKIHFLMPSGIGDSAWVVSKLWKIAEERDCTFWTPEAGIFNRVDPYLDLMGLKHARTSIDIRRLLEYPGEFNEGEYDNGGVFYVHANRHLEEGGKLVDWHPWLPFKNPAPKIVNTGIAKTHPRIIVHMASASYCEGNYFPHLWAKMIRWIEEEIAPVKLIGAKWDEPMIDSVLDIYPTHYPPCIGQTFATALSEIVNSTAMIGVDSGLTIMAAYMEIPALRAYPRWLHKMRGTWEDPQTLHPLDKYIFMDELLDEYRTWCKSLNV